MQLQRPISTLTKHRGRVEGEGMENEVVEEPEHLPFVRLVGDALGERLTKRARVEADVQNKVQTSL